MRAVFVVTSKKGKTAMHYETVWSFETANFLVTLDVAPEEMDPADSFEFEDDITAVRDGRVEWFQARAAVWLVESGAMIGADYLGECAYENIRRDFVESHWRAPADSRNTLAMRAQNRAACDYFPGMIRAAIEDARRAVALVPKLRTA